MTGFSFLRNRSSFLTWYFVRPCMISVDNVNSGILSVLCAQVDLSASELGNQCCFMHPATHPLAYMGMFRFPPPSRRSTGSTADVHKEHDHRSVLEIQEILLLHLNCLCEGQ